MSDYKHTRSMDPFQIIGSFLPPGWDAAKAGEGHIFIFRIDADEHVLAGSVIYEVERPWLCHAYDAEGRSLSAVVSPSEAAERARNALGEA